MAGHGPAPKDPSRRARRNADPVPTMVIEFRPCAQPALPDSQPDGTPWPEQTLTWWRTWRDCAQAEHFNATDWSELVDAALYHAAMWTGSLTAGTELRLRVAKFGATPEDRARLRIQFAQADTADAKRPVTPKPSRERYGNLRAAG